MPFRDRDWEDFQRDCDFFPAYTDYIFGVDQRAEVGDEPGLHPQIFDPPPLPPLPPKRLYSLPQPVQYPRAYDPVRDAPLARPYNVPRPKPMRVKQEPSIESAAPTPCPAPRALPAAAVPPTHLIRPGELLADPSLAFIPYHERVAADRNIGKAWNIINSHAVPAQKMKMSGYIREMSHNVAAKREEYKAREAARLDEEMQIEREWELYEQEGLTRTVMHPMPSVQSACGLGCGRQVAPFTGMQDGGTHY